MKKLFSILLVFIFIMSVFCFPAKADTMDSFTHTDNSDGSLSISKSPEMYTPIDNISSDSLGLETKLSGIADICTDKDGKIYVLCAQDGKSEIVVINTDYTYYTTIKVLDDSQQEVNFAGAKGLYVDKSLNIYIADTSNARVIKTDNNGTIIDVLKQPKSNLIPEDFIYQPVKIGIDNKGYMYILSLGCYYGALSYSPEGEFIGFYGANTVNATVLNTLQFIWDKLTGNDVKRSKSQKTLPYSFVDFCFDSDGYLITCTGKTGSWDNGKGQIQKLSSNGANILYNRSIAGDASSSTSFNFLEDEVIYINGDRMYQDIVSIDSKNGYIFALDTTYGIVYVYDNECNLLNGFGGGAGKGEKLGNFSKAVSLVLHGDNVLVADADRGTITVFEPTKYGKLLLSAQSLYIKGDYEQARGQWEQILSLNRDNQFAYRALSTVYYSEGNYEKAMEYSKAGLDYKTYDLAYQEVLKQKTAQNFALILVAIILLVSAIVYIFILKRKRNLVIIKNEKFKVFIGSIFHPFDSFSAIKYNGQGSLKIATVSVCAFFVSFVVKSTLSEFRFDTTSNQYNIWLTLLTTVGVFTLWVVSNWLICSLFSGKGKLSEVYIASAYTLLPLTLINFVQTILTYVVPFSSAGIITTFGTIAWIYFIFLLCVAMMAIHEYDFFKFVSTTLGVLFLMIFIIFVIVFIVVMLTLMYKFVSNIFEELVYR